MSARAVARRALVLACAFVAAAATRGSAQSMLSIDGVVHTAGAAPAAGAVVTLHAEETGVRRSTLTTAAGRFIFVGLAPGSYTVRVEVTSHQPAVRPLQLVVGQSAHVELVLQPQPLELEPLEVLAIPASPELRRTSVSAAVTERELRQLPFATRNVLELAAVTPGIRAFRTLPQAALRGSTGLPAAGAFADGAFVNMYVDGVPLKSLYSSGIIGFPETGSPLPVDAIREFRVLHNPYDAELAHAGAWLISAETHRGTNETHGSAFGALQDAAFTAVTDWQRAAERFHKPDYVRHNAGVSLRGPLLRDRLFHATSHELSDADHFIIVSPGRPAAQPGYWNEYAGTFRAPNRNRTSLLRLTATPTAAHTVDAIGTARDLRGRTLFGDRVAVESAIEQRYRVETLNLRHRWTPAAHWAHESAVQLVSWRHDERSDFTGPELRYPELQIGRSTPYQQIRERHVRLTQRASVGLAGPVGAHLVRFGVDVAASRAAGRFPELSRGEFTFMRFDAPLPARGRIAVGALDADSDTDAATAVRGTSIGVFVNDEWRPHPRLLLSLGLRYDAERLRAPHRDVPAWRADPELTALPELARFLHGSDRALDVRGVSPRAAASWQPFGDATFLRAGYGIMRERAPRVLLFQVQRDAAWRVHEFLNPGTTDAEVLRQRALAGSSTGAPTLTLMAGDMRSPHVRQWSIGLGRELASGLELNVDVLHQVVRHLHAELNLNWLDRSQDPPRRALTQRYAAIRVWDDFATARYRALLTHMTYRQSAGLNLGLAYTLGFADADWDRTPAPAPAAVREQFYLRQRISGDERHRLVLSGIGGLPFGFAGAAIITLASPRPFPARVGTDVNRNDFLFDDWIGERRYLEPQPSWRNWYRMVDARVARSVGLGRTRVRGSIEVFNLFNTDSYTSFDGVQLFGGEANAGFRQPIGTFSPRQVQLGARFEW